MPRAGRGAAVWRRRCRARQPLLPARVRGAGPAASDLLFGPLPQAGDDTEVAAWQVSNPLQCSAHR